jgi:hypothetical protein
MCTQQVTHVKYLGVIYDEEEPYKLSFEKYN